MILGVLGHTASRFGRTPAAPHTGRIQVCVPVDWLAFHHDAGALERKGFVLMLSSSTSTLSMEFGGISPTVMFP